MISKNPLLDSRMASYKEAIRLCQTQSGIPGATHAELYLEFERLEKAFHYAQRWLPYFTGQAPKSHKESLLLAFEAVTAVIDNHWDGLLYSGNTLRYRPVRQEELNAIRESKKYSQEFLFSENPWYAVACMEKMMGSIRRVKAKSITEVYERLYDVKPWE